MKAVATPRTPSRATRTAIRRWCGVAVGISRAERSERGVGGE